MTDAEPRKLSLLAKLIVALILALIVAGIVWHGVSIPTFRRIWHDLVARPDAPMRFRFILQPLMAAIVAIRHGLKDARTGRSPYFWTMMGTPGERTQRLNEGLNATAKIILLGLVMDMIYQAIVLKQFYPAEAVIVALLFAFVPYVIIRGDGDAEGVAGEIVERGRLSLAPWRDVNDPGDLPDMGRQVGVRARHLVRRPNAIRRRLQLRGFRRAQNVHSPVFLVQHKTSTLRSSWSSMVLALAIG